MDLNEALYTTRAMRRLKPDPISYEAQARILDAAVRAPHVDQGWRFVLVDDVAIKTRLGELYLRAWTRMFDEFGISLTDLKQMDSEHGRSARSGDHLARHFHEVPLILLGVARTRDGSGIYPAIWSAMLAARAEGIGSTLTGVLHSFCPDEVFDLLGVPSGEGWHLHGVVPMGFPLGRWGVATRKPVHAVAARNGWRGISASPSRSHSGRREIGRVSLAGTDSR